MPAGLCQRKIKDVKCAPATDTGLERMKHCTFDATHDAAKWPTFNRNPHKWP
eukprot:CAMPEP_0203975930 /NCGR_PEP_ID=MMETSP0359-20131031/100859_1 /ASSEMBLY_ACC=CAM_ASM_000338 /TAXON_ID=268821 /ORGANISM="Scrippsiella Hangoei, Strain SHTV-5" /LENGTH=51 /DNA_ID=CAMNT_0050914133 /DNA_START=657 /DNA_END=809 /DNA_ORIENTATION=-